MKKLAIIFLVYSLLYVFGSCHKTIIIIEEQCCETCYDGIQNQNETGIDCGGVCAPCETFNDTVIIYDTIIVYDTILIYDTIVVFDTIIIIDTITIGDTTFTIELQPDALLGKDAVIHSIDLFTSGVDEYMWAASWTWNGGNEGIMRALIEFDLSMIPQNALISNARLSLFGKKSPPDQHSIFETYGTYNNAYLKRITSFWSEEEVTWANQPSTTDLNQVELEPSVYPNQNYMDIDVKLLVQDIVADPSSGFGFMLQLKEENVYRMMAFSTSDHYDSQQRPKLVISYKKE